MSGLQIVRRRRLSKRCHYDMKNIYEKYHETKSKIQFVLGAFWYIIGGFIH